jgi:hypothetical protein
MSNLTLVKPDAETIKAAQLMAKTRCELMDKKLREMVQANKHLLEESESPTLYSVTGTLHIAFVVVWNQLTIDKMEDDGLNLTFEGSGWGVGIGGGVAGFTGAFTIPPSQLLGEASYNIFMTGPGTVVDFLKGGKYVGSIVAAGLSVGIGNFVGSGTFSKGIN